MNIISFKNVFYSYQEKEKYAVSDLNLCVAQGEFLAIMGENGAGKTTFCKLINGIIPHLYGGNLSGNITVAGECTLESSVPNLALKVGMVLDDPDTQIFTSSVFSEAAFGPENLLLPPLEIKERVAFALSAVGLGGFENRNPLTLSGGEKQRLVIAAALAMKGKILVLDEPLCRLDPDGALEVMSVLADLREKFQITIVMASHNSAMMAGYADRVCILKNGQIAALDTAKNILSNRSLLEENGIQPVLEQAPLSSKTESLFVSSSCFPCETVRDSEVKEEAVKIKDFCFTYPNGESIENINITIEDNDFVAITGRNGCGKTTLLKNITGLLRPCSGDIYIRGKNTKDLSIYDISKEVGFVMQNPDNQLFTNSVYDEVTFALKNSGFSKKEIRQRAEDALNLVGIKERDVFPHVLSRAGRTETVIACILAMGCRIIIFDEVDIGQDYRGSLKIMNIAKELHCKGYTVIFITHNMSLVHEYAHRLIMMDKKGILMDMKRKKTVTGKVL